MSLGRLSAEEVLDVCSLLSLAERVHILFSGTEGEAPGQLICHLRSLGYCVTGPHRARPTDLSAYDTVVLFEGPCLSADLSILRSVAEVGCVVLAIATEDAVGVNDFADALITLPSRSSHDDQEGRFMAVDLLSSTVVEVIRRDLTQRLVNARLQPSSWPSSWPGRSSPREVV